MKITMLKAKYGDCILFNDENEDIKFMVDCGFKMTYKHEILNVTKNLDFLILTHVDRDHINGIFPMLEDVEKNFSLSKVYLNTPSSYRKEEKFGDISIKDSISLEGILQEKNVDYYSLVKGDELSLSKNIKLEIISPSNANLEYFNDKYKEEYRLTNTPVSVNLPDYTLEELSVRKNSYKSLKSDFVNASSISFIMHYGNKKLLFLGDSHPCDIFDYLIENGYSINNRCIFDYIKLSHHGSSSSISNELISIVSCSDFLISTNGGKAPAKHPSREVLAKIILNMKRHPDKSSASFFFNYPTSEIERKNGCLLSEYECNEYNVNLFNTNEITI